MKKIILLVGFCCLCLTSTGHAYPQSGHYGKGYGNNYGCEKKIARLEEKRQIALKYNRVEQVKGIDRALENTRRHCGRGEDGVREYGGRHHRYENDRYEDRRGDANGRGRDRMRKNWDEMGEGAKEQWEDLKEDTQENLDDLKESMGEGLEALEDKVDTLKEEIRELEKDLSRAIAKGAQSDTVKNIQKKLEQSKKSMRDFLDELDD